ncbi:hypothetical protein B5K11_09855 [Rhizobium leguminosarum bv. trifolii]|uniref:hypothetical protein n=1 Tax=Rhizobium leguminosarum TaxID=384 RepID=UPI000E2F877E|nr:hypothetical protein [Rhizobium leguminosarum]RFB95242.1 hypothetical protein B5K11_09855 [Rhizobium leguminosarum bv. trifolii]
MQTLEQQKATVVQLRKEIEQARDVEALKSILHRILDIVGSSLDEDVGGWAGGDQATSTE